MDSNIVLAIFEISKCRQNVGRWLPCLLQEALENDEKIPSRFQNILFHKFENLRIEKLVEECTKLFEFLEFRFWYFETSEITYSTCGDFLFFWNFEILKLQNFGIWNFETLQLWQYWMRIIYIYIYMAVGH